MRTQDCRSLIAQYRRDLEVALQRREVRGEMQRLRETYPVFKKHGSVEELAALVKPGNRAYADKDAVLGILVGRIQMDRQRTLFPLLILVFWDSLCNIFWRKVASCPDPEDLFLRVHADFFQVAVTYPLDRRPEKVNVNLYLDTWKKVTAWQREEAEYREQYEHLGPAHELGMVPADVQQSPAVPEQVEEDLLELVYQNVISETQCDLLLETDVYGRMTEKEWAEAHGVNHSTVRTWRHRAEKAIRKHEEEKRRRRDQDVLD